MEIVLHDIKDSEAWAIAVKVNDVTHYTLHYDKEIGEGVLHTDDSLVSFSTFEQLSEFCASKQLTLGGNGVAHEFDFNFEITENAHCKLIVEHWNLLAVMAGALGEDFGISSKEYEKLYAKLFEGSKDYETTIELDEAELERLKSVFDKMKPILDKFAQYTEQ